MRNNMKTVIHRSGILHVETPLGIVNIYAGLSDRRGREVVAIEVLKDEHASEPKVQLVGPVNTRLIRLKTVRNK